MVKVVTVEQMRAIEKATDAAGVSYNDMMQYAGRAVAEVVKRVLGKESAGKRVAVLVGPGNNGGDGLVAARILREETQAEVGCYLLKPRTEDDKVFVAARDAGVFMAVAADDQRWRVLKNLVSAADVVVDALLGTGARLPIAGDMEKVLRNAATALERSPFGPAEPRAQMVWPAVPQAPAPRRAVVVAVDCPSGLDCDSGALDPATIPADYTVTFAAAKHGQLIFPGAAAVGELIVADIGTPPGLPELDAVRVELATAEGVGEMLPPRPLDAHKGTFGRVVVLAGSVNYTGAATLAAEAAYRVGAGLVTLAVPEAIQPVLAAHLREATWLLLPHDMGVLNADALEVLREEVGEYDALLLGPGLGRAEPVAEFMRGFFEGPEQAKKGSIGFVAPARAGVQTGRFQLHAPLVIDADGLNLLAEIEGWWRLLPDGTILTPHPGEMARLSNLDREAIQADRIGVASQKAAEWGCVVVLKGAFTVVAEPSGRVVVIPFATDALATAGTGDVLSGCIAGLLAQRLPPFEAAVVGAYLHGLAGRIAAEKGSSRSVVAGDVLAALSAALARIDPRSFHQEGFGG